MYSCVFETKSLMTNVLRSSSTKTENLLNQFSAKLLFIHIKKRFNTLRFPHRVLITQLHQLGNKLFHEQ